MSIWGWIAITMQSHRAFVLKVVSLAVVIGGAQALGPTMLQRVVDEAVAGKYAGTQIAMLLVLYTLSSLPIIYWLRGRFSARYSFELEQKVYAHLLRMDLSFYDARGSTVVVNQVTKGVNATVALVGIMCNGRLLIQIPVAVYAAYYIGQHSLGAIAVFGLYVFCFGVVAANIGGKIATTEEQYHDIDNAITHRQREVIQHISVVKVHDAQQSEMLRFETEGEKAKRLRIRLTNLYALFNLFSQNAGVFASTVIIIAFIPQVITGQVTVGTFLALTTLASRLLQPASDLGDLYAEIKGHIAAVKPLLVILQQKASVVESSRAVNLQPVRMCIQVSGVNFSYGDGRSILQGINLHIPAGKMTAFVGPSGGGKTTLAKVITRLYDPTQGQVLFDGMDVRYVSFSSLYAQVAYLSQEIPIFTGTVADNVGLGRMSLCDQVVQQALELSSAGFVDRLEHGVHEKIGEMGKKLSGGERQRLALARLLARTPSVIVLDEATSALDNATESLVQEALEQLSLRHGSLTTIVIAHRLSTIHKADQIVVVDEGRVVDTGTHDELMERCTLYRSLNEKEIKQ